MDSNEILQEDLKYELFQSIMKKQLDRLKFLFIKYNILPDEEISDYDQKWTCFHVACYSNSATILLFLYKICYNKQKSRFLQIINEETIEGWTPASICCIYDSVETLSLILKIGGIEITDNLLEIAYHYAAINCIELLKNFSWNKISKNYINTQYLIEDEINDLNNIFGGLSLENDGRIIYNSLFITGERKPCIICKSNLGYLKYYKCCGEPIHYICEENIKSNRCLNCHNLPVVLITDVIIPEKGFQ